MSSYVSTSAVHFDHSEGKLVENKQHCVILLTHSVECLTCTLSYKPSCNMLLSNRIDYLLSVLISCFQQDKIVMLVKFHVVLWLSHLELDC